MNIIEKIRNKKNVVNAVIYARFSSDNQREESIIAQTRAINEYAKKNKINIINEYIDKAKSATTDNRPEFLRMIRDSKEGRFDIVLVHKLDRFARNRKDSIGYRMELKKHGVSLISILEYLDDSPESIILESVLEAMSEYYSKNLAREVNKGMRETALKGLHTGGCPPLGYDVDPDTKKLVINQREAVAVRLIFKMYNEGFGYDKIVHELNLQGFKTKKNVRFGKGSLGAIIKNEKYTGVYIFNKSNSKDIDGKRNGRDKDDTEIIRVEGAIPAIISKEEFEIARDKKNSRRRSFPNYTSKEIYLLTSKIVCGECGGSFIGNRNKCGRSKSLYVTYRCVTRKSKHGCSNKDIRREYIETFVLKSLANYIYNDKLIPKLVESYREYQMERNSEFIRKCKGVKERLDAVKKDIDNLVVLIVKMPTSESLANKLNENELEKNQLEIEYDRLIRGSDYNELSIEDFKKSFHNARSLMEEGKVSTTKRLIEMYVDKVVVYNDHVDVIFKFHEDLVLPDRKYGNNLNCIESKNENNEIGSETRWCSSNKGRMRTLPVILEVSFWIRELIDLRKKSLWN